MRVTIALIALLGIAFVPLSCRSSSHKDSPVIGSKKFTESVVLGELARLLSNDAGFTASHERELGGTQLVYKAMLNGELDIYPEYTGTIAEEILANESVSSEEEMRAALAARNVLMSQPLGFNNTYVLAMKKDRAAELGVAKISDLIRHPALAFGFSSEFMERSDGWPSLKEHYGLPHDNVAGRDHDIAYAQLNEGAIDVIDAYATDAKIAKFDLQLLEDDREFFPRYDAVLLYRDDLEERFPGVTASIRRLEGNIAPQEMAAANMRVEVDSLSEARVAADFLKNKLDVDSTVRETRWPGRVWNTTLEHLDLVRKSLIPAILLAIPLGVFAARMPRLGQGILATVGIIQTIPALALLVLLIPAMNQLGLKTLGSGSATAITALFLYSLLPIVRSTHTGLTNIAAEHLEAARALGLSESFRLWHIELPLATPSILSGIKTAAVINVGFATLGALTGAGGYGQPILTGIRLDDTPLILEGAVPAAVLALMVQAAFEFSERYLVPLGLRLNPQQ